jgi:hypothetical protein
MKTTVLMNVRNRFRISIYSGTAKNLRDLSSGEKMENFGKIGQFGERRRSDLLSAYVNMIARGAYDTAPFQKLLSRKTMSIFQILPWPLVELTSLWTNSFSRSAALTFSLITSGYGDFSESHPRTKLMSLRTNFSNSPFPC